MSVLMARRSRFNRDQALRDIECNAHVVRDQTFDSRDMSASRPAALSRGPNAKPRSKVVARSASRPAAAKRARIPGWTRPARIRCKPWSSESGCCDRVEQTSATVPSTTQVEQFSEVRPGHSQKAPLRIPRAGQHGVEHHANAGEGLARKIATRLIGVHDHVGWGVRHQAGGDR